MSAEDFLRRVELTGLVSEPLMEELRKRVANSDRALRPEMLAKLLVDREELTAGQARKIIGQMMDGANVPLQAPSKESETDNGESANANEPVIPKAPGAEPVDEDNSLTLVSENDDLDFAREEEDAPVTLSAEDVLGTSEAGPDLIAGGSNLNGDDILGDLGASPPPIPKQSPPKVSDSSGTYDLEPVEDEVAEAILLDDDDSSIEVIDDGSASVATQIDTPASGLDDVLSDPMIGESNVVIRRRKSFWGIFDGLLPKRGPRKNRWDSPLILLGGGALVLLILSAVGFLALFRGESADQLFSAGQDAYENQSYAQAITTFNRFTTRFAENPKVSLARVRIDMSKIREITDISNPDWEAALAQASTSLPSIKTEESFGDARSELAKLLPDIAAGLVEKSRKADSRMKNNGHSSWRSNQC